MPENGQSHGAVAQDWTRQEAGWYTKYGVGGIVQEINGWWYYPVLALVPKRGEIVGPFKTMRAAMEEADRAE